MRQGPKTKGGAGRHRIATGLLIALLVPLGALANSAEMEGLSDEDRAAILALARANDTAWNARDAEAFASTYTRDARNVVVGTPVDLRGRDAIRAHFARSFLRIEPAIRHRTIVDELVPVAPDVVVAGGQVLLERRLGDGTAAPLQRFAMTAVLVREKNVWRIRTHRAHPQ